MTASKSEFSIWITEYARVEQYPVGGVLYGHHNEGTLVLPYCYGVICNDDHVILVDTGFDNAEFGQVLATQYGVSGWAPPSKVLGRIGIDAKDVDIVILTHNHFDHAGNVDAFPNARVYIQEREVSKFLWAKSLPQRLEWLTTACDPDDLLVLMDKWKEGKLTLVQGEMEVVPGVWVHPAHDTHTLGSQYVTVDDGRGSKWVMAGDNVYVFENIEGLNRDGKFVPIGLLFGSATQQMLCMEEMYQIVNGDTRRVLPFHEVKMWERFPTHQFDDGLHIAEISLRDKDKGRISK
ncbi:MAG: N-acyl homoserine lactonase family protein [Alicyclobacillus sp.]|nr:N-acyl homoserine lactonase family protein [Alicyclobacillus sp.]